MGVPEADGHVRGRGGDLRPGVHVAAVDDLRGLGLFGGVWVGLGGVGWGWWGWLVLGFGFGYLGIWVVYWPVC